MGNRRILTGLLTAFLIILMISSCKNGSDALTSAGGVTAMTPDDLDGSGYTVTAKSKTPTPQAEFDPQKFPAQTQTPGENEGAPDPGIPRYEVDALSDPVLAGFADLSGMFESLHAANDGVVPEEQAGNLFDGYESSKYCVLLNKTVEVIWSMDSELPVSAYALVTGNDTAGYPERNPPAWELYGSADGSGESWELIDSVNTPELPTENYAYKGYILDQTVRYRYFRIVFRSEGEPFYIQLSELRLYTDDPGAAGFADGNSPEDTQSLFELIDRSTIKGPAGFNSHTVDCLFDNLAKTGADGSNKYCVVGGNVTVEWQMKKAVVITDYVVYTANDAQALPDRNPIRWTLYGSTDGTDYEVVHEVNSAGLPEANYTPTAYQTGSVTAYRYYRLEISTVKNADCLQLSEISLFTRNFDN